jgi:hypothetical protein
MPAFPSTLTLQGKARLGLTAHNALIRKRLGMEFMGQVSRDSIVMAGLEKLIKKSKQAWFPQAR